MNTSSGWEGVAVGFIFGMALAAPLFYWIGTAWHCGNTPEVAICRAVLASKHGEYIEVEEE